jgi:hypothetical protein
VVVFFKPAVRAGLDILKSCDRSRPKGHSRRWDFTDQMSSRIAAITLFEVVSSVQISSHESRVMLVAPCRSSGRMLTEAQFPLKLGFIVLCQ